MDYWKRNCKRSYYLEMRRLGDECCMLCYLRLIVYFINWIND